MTSAKFRASVLPPLFAAALASALAAPGAWADQRDDFLAGRTKMCAGCDLTGANFKRRDLTGADLTGVTWQNTRCPDLSYASAPNACSP